MDLILVKIFATALALSEVMTQPQAVEDPFRCRGRPGQGGADATRRVRPYAPGIRYRIDQRR